MFEYNLYHKKRIAASKGAGLLDRYFTNELEMVGLKQFFYGSYSAVQYKYKYFMDRSIF